MKLKVLRKQDSLLEFEVDGATHTFLNLLREYLKEHENVQFAAYRVTIHTKPVFYLRTVQGADPIATVKEANKRIIDVCSSLQKDIEKQSSMLNVTVN